MPSRRAIHDHVKSVQVDKLNPVMKTMIINSATLTENGDEKTVLRFRLDSAGEILSSNTLQKSLTKIARP